MKNPFRGTWQRALLRPLIYMATNRFLAALALLLLYLSLIHISEPTRH